MRWVVHAKYKHHLWEERRSGRCDRAPFNWPHMGSWEFIPETDPLAQTQWSSAMSIQISFQPKHLTHTKTYQKETLNISTNVCGSSNYQTHPRRKLPYRQVATRCRSPDVQSSACWHLSPGSLGRQSRSDGPHCLITACPLARWTSFLGLCGTSPLETMPCLQ